MRPEELSYFLRPGELEAHPDLRELAETKAEEQRRRDQRALAALLGLASYDPASAVPAGQAEADALLDRALDKVHEDLAARELHPVIAQLTAEAIKLPLLDGLRIGLRTDPDIQHIAAEAARIVRIVKRDGETRQARAAFRALVLRRFKRSRELARQAALAYEEDAASFCALLRLIEYEEPSVPASVDPNAEADEEEPEVEAVPAGQAVEVVPAGQAEEEQAAAPDGRSLEEIARQVYEEALRTPTAKKAEIARRVKIHASRMRRGSALEKSYHLGCQVGGREKLGPLAAKILKRKLGGDSLHQV